MSGGRASDRVFRYGAATIPVRNIGFVIAPLLVLVSALLATGCASMRPERELQMAPGGFELTGRVAVRHGGDGTSGRIEWRHSPAADDILISSPIGQGIARITRRGGAFKLVTADQKEYVASDAEALTEQVLGWRLPLAGLPEWVQGRADPARAAQRSLDAQSRISELKQDDWTVEYLEFEGARPSKLRISRANLEIRLVVDQWLAPE
jgi:outer membrane lipoprotein LolB